MKSRTLKLFLAMSFIGVPALVSCSSKAEAYDGNMSVQIELVTTIDSPRVSRITVGLDDTVSSKEDFKDVFTLRTCGTKAVIKDAYYSDENGNETKTAGKYVSFHVSGTKSLFETSFTTAWVESYPVSVELNEGKEITIGKKKIDFLSLESEGLSSWVCPEGDAYAKDSYSDGDLTLTRALYTPEEAKTDNGKNPLIVWLHGGGEGGTDINLDLLRYKTTALSDTSIQSYFTDDAIKGAYVSVIQCPTMWLDAGDGTVNSASTVYEDGQPSIYTEILHKAIADQLEKNPDIDPDRVYITGCSNGGYMALKLATEYGNEYAGYAAMCQAYSNANMTDALIEKIKDLPIWFIQSEDDITVNPKAYGIPIYYRLLKAGAENVHYTMLTGVGHNCWNTFFADGIHTDFDKEKVIADYDNLVFEDQAITSDCYVNNANCNVESGSIFAWMSSLCSESVDF